MTEELLNKIAFFLSAGEQAPLSSATEVRRLTAKQRNYFVEELSKLYQRQQEEYDRAKRK